MGNPSSAWTDRVAVLAPAGEGETLPEFLAASRNRSGKPFEPARRAALDAFSRSILRDSLLRADASSVALAYWLRRGSMEALIRQLSGRMAVEPEVVFAPAGRVFHVAPANVDTLFVYSWALSYLCGNTNVVRLSTNRSPVTARLLDRLDAVMQSDPAMTTANRFVTYEHDQEITEALSGWCSHRVIWGGNETVAAVRSAALNPHAGERAFSSKFSYAVVAADALLQLSEDGLARVASGFFNDVFWFDQMACSSPQIVFWLGGADTVGAATDRLESALAREAERRGFLPPVPSAVRRRDFAFVTAATSGAGVRLDRPAFVSVTVSNVGDLRRDVCGGGVLQHVCAPEIETVAAFAEEGDQTITHFGLSEAELTRLAELAGARGVDRLVPIGEALAFGTNWDGFDLVQDFLRKVVVRTGTPDRRSPGGEAE